MHIVAQKPTDTKYSAAESFDLLWNMVKQPGAVVEVRALLKTASEWRRAWTGFGSTITGYFDDPVKFAASLAALEESGRASSVYVTMNPVAPDLAARAYNRLIAAKSGETTSDDQIMRRCWLLIDADPIRPSGISASDEELSAAIERRDEIAGYLGGLGWPEPARARSGNGAHLLYRIDLPNDTNARDLISNVLQALQLQFGDSEGPGVAIDTSVYNAARITKAYGTTARKGDDLPGRPHRLSYIESDPGELEPVAPSQLGDLAAIWTSYQAALKAEQEAKRTTASGDNVIALFNERNPIEETLSKYGYAQSKRPNRWDDPRKQGSNGVLVDKAANKAYANSDNDPMKNGHRFDPFDLFTRFEHSGDSSAAYKAAKKAFGLWEDTPAAPALVWSTNGGSAGGATTAAQPSKTGRELADSIVERIKEIAQGEGEPADKQRTVADELSEQIGNLDRAYHGAIASVLVDGEIYKKTAAGKFVNDCAADAKRRAKEAARARRRQRQKSRAALSELPIIQVNARQLPDITADALSAIQKRIEAEPQYPALYVRGGALSRIVADENETSGIQQLVAPALEGIMARCAVWIEVGMDMEGSETQKDVFPPGDVVQDLLHMGEWDGIPPLVGVTPCPVYAPGGALHSEPGYSATTRIYSSYEGALGDTEPTAANVEAAKRLIFGDLLVDFPFDSEASKAHALVLLLQPIVRPMIDGPTPILEIDAPARGSGKGKLAEACSYPSRGRPLVSNTIPEKNEEMRKTLTGIFLEGDPHILFDNATGIIDHAALASATTQPVWGDRFLGKNQNVIVPIYQTFILTANNPQMNEDIARRCVRIRIDTNLERPDQRTGFKHPELEVWTRENREQLLTAACTLVNKWIADGMPRHTKRTKGSYESWAAIMGGILDAVGVPGFLENDGDLMATATGETALWAEFVAQWWELHKDSEVYPADLFIIASQPDDWQTKLTTDPNEIGYNLLAEVVGTGRELSRRTRLGKALEPFVDRVIDGKKIIRISADKKRPRYKLVEVDQAACNDKNPAGVDAGVGETPAGVVGGLDQPPRDSEAQTLEF